MIISVPKGRIYSCFYKFLKEKKIKIYNKNNRKLILNTNSSFKVALLKQTDTIYYLINNYVDFSIVGFDFFLEKNFFKLIKKNIIGVKKMNFFKCGLYLIRKKNKSYKRKRIVISTKYINITKKYYKNFKKKVININGSNELAIKFKISDFIIDIVDTGKTLKDNNLKKIYKLFDIFPVIIYLKKNIDIKKISFLYENN
ncbi:ATP phosphoribosyltransferase [Candidatus Vidania fulgoroideae]|uniref:ATP phosphoribosyltransferase n=1 Tax=Candidatus Vidania fulgoroideorum TaxID=881286 RepID=A0AAX3N8I2_9PROT|nr:ATP phosphoribosyltransferase [Candidatus Vidania fulgoroideae]WDR79361.1 ATP phosphoribosyltransferase [Candidatus Vidania fulgoroideae]